ncbi:hypothetical protein GSY71_10765 [Pusillimonas sp. TS35]|uniref:hypothetical protein n=1 Tax=Paracandidimonas lactea TaxID=2895524 RepID=UPI00136B2ECA|nr:hypothetical protein [Paracandidimonas lactea]MYN13614.1 hypothetical protein [Pusillimonas sp. TS35]
MKSPPQPTSFLPRRARLAASAVVLGLLAACANMSQTPPGSPLSVVEAKWGKPGFSCPGPNGTQRVIWSQQPLGQYAWGANVNASGNIDRIEPLLTDRHFEKLRTGTWTRDQVRCEFGPPADISTVGLPSNTQLVWSYRYLQSGVWNSLMYVYFGTDGERVTSFHPGPDPMYEQNDNSWFN